ncbi:MAG: GNAT family N-acetyltransferase [Candidatus Hodarchaeales archaeon]|jgi:RimJ/RimL family protein N-acetyltransferase
MIEEITKSDFKKVKNIFTPFSYQVIVNSLIEGDSDGRIWVDDLIAPKSALMLSTEGYFLAGDPNNEAFNNDLRDLILKFIDSKYFPFYEGCENFFFYATEDWKPRFVTLFPTREPFEIIRNHFIITKGNRLFDWKAKIPENYQIKQINNALELEKYELEDDVKEWVGTGLNSMIKRGYGACMLHNDRIIVWSNADCASGDRCEIGIFASEHYRRKGFASITAAAAVEFSFKSGFLAVGWHCEDHNYGSIGVARKVGFTKKTDYIMYSCMFDEAEHLAELGMRLFWEKNFKGSIKLFEEAFRKGKVPVWGYYLAARAHSSLGNIKVAIMRLKDAVDHGWENIDHTEQCMDFEPLHHLNQWNEILSQIRENQNQNI